MSVVEERVAGKVFDALRSITEDDFVRALRAPRPTTKSRNQEITEHLVQRVFTDEEIAASVSSIDGYWHSSSRDK